ncbi:MAG: hypothetical protein IJM59_05805 [Proteobacteria bacterium]|nr:hypothetical protein [Pseudomonadota bacterium]
MTVDGRWYPGLAIPKYDQQKYYVPGGMDTTLETVAIFGDCVLDRTDGIPLFSENTDARDNYACDRQICPCGTTSCSNGDLCKDGKCTMDMQKPIVLNDSNSIYEYFYSDYTTAGGGCWGKVPDIYHQLFNTCEETVDDYCTFDIPDEDREYGADFGLRSYDAEACKGGKRYCHGRGNFPMTAPKDAAGYVCKTIYEMPGYKSKDPLKAWICDKEDGCICGGKSCAIGGACIDEKCYCGTEILPDHYKCEDYCEDDKCAHKKYGIQCHDESCACGQDTCNKGDFCRNGQCFCDAIPSPRNGYICENQIELTNYYTTRENISDIKRHYLMCTQEDGCKCGDNTCMSGMYCIIGNCYCGASQTNTLGKGLKCIDKYPKCVDDTCNCYGHQIHKGEMCSPLQCGYYGTLDADGCKCGGVPMNEELYSCELGKESKPVAICKKGDGCKCGETQCRQGMACYQNQCVDFLMLKPEADNYIFNPQTGLPVCSSTEGCACGKITCEKGKHCLNGVCFKDPFTKKFDDKVYYYRIINADISYDDVASFRPVNLLLENEKQKLCEYEKKLVKYYKDVGYTDEIYFKKYKDDSFDNHLCADPKYKDITIGEFLKNCGTGPIPADVAVKYCYLGIEYDIGEEITDISISYSGWEDEGFKFNSSSAE